MSTVPATMTRAAFARHQGVDRAHITRLAKAGRLVLTEDGKLVRVAESIALLGATLDPSKDGVRERFAEKRVGAAAVQAALEPDTRQGATAAPAPESSTGAGDGTMMDDRRELIREQAAYARLKRLEIEGRLVDAEDVRRVTFEKARVARNALMGMVDVIASPLAAESDPARVHAILQTEIRRVCEELAAGEAEPTRQ